MTCSKFEIWTVGSAFYIIEKIYQIVDRYMKDLLRFLKEDIGKGDITTDTVIPEKKTASAVIRTKDTGILAGLEETTLLLDHFDLEYTSKLKDGARINKGDVILEIHGNARKILYLERLVLNILSRMSGVATKTDILARKCRRYGVAIAGTRKTTPGFRRFEKKAIVIGGGKPHRMGLFDAILIKDNHINAVGLRNAIRKAKQTGKKVEVEVSTSKDAFDAVRFGADTIMLDNMDRESAGKIINKLRGRVLIEISGGITIENVEDFARLKPDIISSGSLTTKSEWLDMNLTLKCNNECNNNGNNVR